MGIGLRRRNWSRSLKLSLRVGCKRPHCGQPDFARKIATRRAARSGAMSRPCSCACRVTASVRIVSGSWNQSILARSSRMLNISDQRGVSARGGCPRLSKSWVSRRPQCPMKIVDIFCCLITHSTTPQPANPATRC